MGFCSVNDIEFLTRVTYNTETTPTQAQVEDWISIFSVEVENVLLEQGIAVPISTDKFYSTLRKNVSFAVTGLILNQNNNEEKTAVNYFEEYNKFINDIKIGKYNNQRTCFSENQIVSGMENKDSIKYNDWENDYDY